MFNYSDSSDEDSDGNNENGDNHSDSQRSDSRHSNSSHGHRENGHQQTPLADGGKVSARRLNSITSVHRKLPPFCYNAEIVRMMSLANRAEYFAGISGSKSDVGFIPFLNKADATFKYPVHYGIGSVALF
jgi:hypothetical protein